MGSPPPSQPTDAAIASNPASRTVVELSLVMPSTITSHAGQRDFATRSLVGRNQARSDAGGQGARLTDAAKAASRGELRTASSSSCAASDAN